MTIAELNELITGKLGIDVSTISVEPFGVRFDYRGSRYFVDINLMVEKVDGACLVTNSDARQLEKLLRGEQWDGTGLPPVGTECEYKWQNDRWRPGKVCYLSKHTVLMLEIFNGEESESCYGSDDVRFRPLRTERDKAIEQIRKVGSSLPASVPFAIEEAAAIYDAIVAGKIDGLGKVG